LRLAVKPANGSKQRSETPFKPLMVVAQDFTQMVHKRLEHHGMQRPVKTYWPQSTKLPAGPQGLKSRASVK
jgi:hypothetical protein